MKKKEVLSQVSVFCNEWYEINSAYEDYARTKEISYTSLYILTMIANTEDCTQKSICEKTFLPKQTVNAIITAFYKNGYVELREFPSDRRNKTIHLTERGDEYAQTIVPHIQNAEYKAMEALSPEQRALLIESISIYSRAFRVEMLKKDE